MHESGQMYLETILILSKRTGNVRAIDIAEEMGISKPSVSRALTRLKDEACITVDSGGHISFTEKGSTIAEMIYERHRVLTALLTGIGVDEATASVDACKIEHDISERSFEAIKAHISRMNAN